MPSCIEKRRAQCRAYGAKHREEQRARHKEWRKKNPDYRLKRRHIEARHRLQRLAKKYGTTADAMLAAKSRQGNACALCCRSGRLVVDHDHETGLFRGWLCVSCNGSLGVLGDNAAGLMRALLYVSQSRHVHEKQNESTGVLA